MDGTVQRSAAAHIGGSIVAIVVATVVLLIMSTVVAFLFSMLQYFMSSMRIEAALFFGNIAGGIAGVHAARLACDAMIKSYSLKAVFWWIAAFCSLGLAAQVYLGLEWESLLKFASIFAIGGSAFLVFYKDDM
jgi:hypothetical protein